MRADLSLEGIRFLLHSFHWQHYWESVVQQMVKQDQVMFMWEPQAVERSVGGVHVKHIGEAQVSFAAAIQIAKQIFIQLGANGVWFGAEEIEAVMTT